VAFGVLPLFAFVAAGFPLLDMTRTEFAGPLPLGVILALVVGKPLGVLAFCGAAVALKWARLPAGATWLEFVGATMLLGVGFTLSLFIGAMALPGNTVVDGQVRLGVIAGSALSAALGAAVLAVADRRRRASVTREAYG
jgi:NhaA family Na+:H+ antiporter